MWNFWLYDFLKVLSICSKKDSEYICTWTCSVFILPEEYWWIGCGGLAPKFWFLRKHYVLVPLGTLCSGSFGDILITIWGRPLLYTNRIFWKARDIHAMAYVLFYSGWLNMQFTNLFSQYNIHWDPNHTIVSFLLCALCIYIRYLLSVVLTFILTLQMI